MPWKILPLLSLSLFGDTSLLLKVRPFYESTLNPTVSRPFLPDQDHIHSSSCLHSLAPFQKWDSIHPYSRGPLSANTLFRARILVP